MFLQDPLVNFSEPSAEEEEPALKKPKLENGGGKAAFRFYVTTLQHTSILVKS